ncbi:MAG: carboxypeptidase regulatory-like domain-containing protein [Cytophagales bacterium]|nr:carboxypeptidase regulatory-like domain-containing protein [Cytophagales bacterium]
MKKRTIYSWMLSLSLLAGSITLNSCRDTFTEEQVLKEQQTIDLSITALDRYESKGLAGAKVTFQQDGQELSQTTNESGVATFADVKIGSNLIVTISKEGFATTRQTISTVVGSFRESQISRTADMYALDGISTGIIRGKVEIQTDLTNDKTELVPANTPVEAYRRFDDANGVNEISIKGQIDANGMYSLKVPATKDGMNYRLIFPTLELDQKIAKNRNVGDKEFPATEPSIDNIKTVFDPASFSTADVPSVWRTVYAVIEAPNDPAATTKKQAALYSVSVDQTTGKVTGLSNFEAGAGYKDPVRIELKSLLGGTGATLEVKVNTGVTNGSLSFPSITAPGSGYVMVNNINTANEEAPVPPANQTVKSGDIKVVNVKYGTGTSRAKDIQ